MTLPAKLVLKGGDSALGQGNGAGDGCKQHQQKEQDAHHVAKAHALEHLGDGNEHQRRTGLQSIRVAAGEGEHRRNDHQARHDGDGRVEQFHILGGFLNGDILFHIGAKSDQNAHGDGQRIEHLAHGCDHRHPRKICHIRHQKISDACQRATAMIGLIMVALGSLSALGYGPLAGVTVFGMQFLDFFDFLTNSVMMPIAAITTCLLVSRVIGVEKIEEEVTLDSKPFRRKKIFNFMIQYLCPIFAAIILISSVANALGWIAM